MSMQVLCTYMVLCKWTVYQCNICIHRLETEYKVIEHLGVGGFGVVYCVKNKLDDTEYAVKMIKLPKK